MPAWLHWLAIGSLVLAGACALVIVLHEMRHPQHMWIMNVVWPMTASFGSVLALWAYFRVGTLGTHAAKMAAEQ